MKVSVIIATKNEEQNLGRLLESIKRQSHKDKEIIVVDNFSTDKTLKIAKKFTKKVYSYGPERSSQRNYGLKKAEGKYVLFLDADMELENDVLAQSTQLLERGPKFAGIVINEISKGTNFLAKVKALEKKIYEGQELIETPRFFRKRDLQKIGAFDKELISGEDWDLAQRIQKLGTLGRIEAKIIHWEHQSLIADLRKKFYYAQHIYSYAKKHPAAFKKQSRIFPRVKTLFSKPNLVIKSPDKFITLVILKAMQYFTFVLSKLKSSF